MPSLPISQVILHIMGIIPMPIIGIIICMPMPIIDGFMPIIMGFIIIIGFMPIPIMGFIIGGCIIGIGIAFIMPPLYARHRSAQDRAPHSLTPTPFSSGRADERPRYLVWLRRNAT